MKKFNLFLAILALSATLPASAHYLWLEQADGQAKLFFGEYENNLREKSGGRLDTIAAPEVKLLDAAATKLSLKRNADYIAVEGVKAQPVIASELSMKVKDMTKYNFGIVKPMYYARIGSGAAESASANALDIQPLGNNKLLISLNGKPLAKSKLIISAPNQWQQELNADDKGEVTFNTPWTGLYVMEVVNLEPSKGSYQGETYENIRHVSTLSVIKK
ncbi:MAG TPA: hypothetical protein VES38_05205 [Methylotenera sp.]|nr:hypothetical protein [Methylotenera sp.]